MATKIVTKNSSTASAVPTASDLVQGELAVNVADKRLFTENNAGAIVELGTNPSTLTVTGEITANGGIALGDGDVATFGDSDDLSIQHLAGTTYLTNTTGSLVLRSDSFRVLNTANSEQILHGDANGAVTAYYDNFVKLATTATGIDVTGTATMDGLTVNTGSYGAVGAGSGRMYGSSSHGLVIQGSGTTNDFLFLGSDGSDSFRIANNKDISFYEDTGTTPKLFWDASAESLTVGNSSGLTNTAGFSGTLGVKGSLPSITIEDTGTGTGKYTLGVTSGNFGLWDSTSSSYRMFVSSAGNVGIGASSPSSKIHVENTAGGSGGYAKFTDVTYGGDVRFGMADGVDNNAISGVWSNNDYLLYTNSTERMRIDSAGNVGIGTSSPVNNANKTTLGLQGTWGGQLDIMVGSTVHAQFGTDNFSSGQSCRIQSQDGIVFKAGGSAERMRIDSAGNVSFANSGGIIKAIGSDVSLVQGAIGLRINDASSALSPTTASANNDASVDLGVSNIRFKDLYLSGAANVGSVSASNSVFDGSGGVGGISLKATYSGATKFQVQNTGNVFISGALSKGSGSFKIDHPLPAKTQTHNLVHSFIEGPQADNIYRGKVDLVDGLATVNIDDAAGMTEGTYVLLNTNTQCFTSNESGWTAVKGSVSGNILTITAQESCSDTISWMVVGERHDQHMLDTEWTDENGKVIVEPLKQLEA